MEDLPYSGGCYQSEPVTGYKKVPKSLKNQYICPFFVIILKTTVLFCFVTAFAEFFCIPFIEILSKLFPIVSSLCCDCVWHLLFLIEFLAANF